MPAGTLLPALIPAFCQSCLHHCFSCLWLLLPVAVSVSKHTLNLLLAVSNKTVTVKTRLKTFQICLAVQGLHQPCDDIAESFSDASHRGSAMSDASKVPCLHIKFNESLHDQ